MAMPSITAAMAAQVAGRVGSPRISRDSSADITGTAATPNSTTAAGAEAIPRQKSVELRN